MTETSLWDLDSVSLAPGRLRNVSTQVHAGVTAVVGWSGAGKTSLLNLLAGFEKPTSGRIRGTHAAAWVPQNGALWPHCTARAQIQIAARSDDVTRFLKAFDLENAAELLPADLSEGEQSRVAVARALASHMPVIVMDEPLVHVDPARVGKYWRAIEEHLTITRASLIFATHEPTVAMGHASRVICLHAGRIVHEGPVADLYANPASEELMNYLGPGNWFTPEEAERWCNMVLATSCCFRPERIALTPELDSPIVVKHSTFVGALETCQLSHESTGAERVIAHRPAGPTAVGTRVAVRMR